MTMKRRRTLIVASSVALLPVLWFLLVDWSWFEESCPDCLYARSVFQYRVGTVVVNERTAEHHSLIERVAEALGTPCRHPSLCRWHKHRWWGLCFCAHPCSNGTSQLAVDENLVLGDEFLAHLGRRAGGDPQLADEFRRRVLQQHDWPFWHELLSKESLNDANE
jgi:hypothetical protein